MKIWSDVRQAVALVSSVRGVPSAVRRSLALLFLAVGLVATPAMAQSPANISYTATPTTFHDAGEVLTTTLTFNTGSRVFTNLISFDLNGVLVPATCNPSTYPDTNATISCTATYTIQPSDLYINKLLRVRAKFNALGSTITLPYITTSVTYIPTLVTPTITSVSPTSGVASGGTTVAITGTDFNSITAVSFGGVAATAYTVNSPTQITATAPAGTGVVDIQATNAAGTSATSAADRFTYVSPPTVTAISPTSGPTSGATSVVVTGTNFAGASAVTFGGASATSFTVNSNTQITATSPAGSGTVDVRVANVAGNSATSAADQFTYIAAPVVTAISPTSGPSAGGTSVVITGSNFLATSGVSFGGTPAAGFTINSNSQITATAPAGSGTVDVRVSSTGGTSATSAADQFTYVGAPTVTSVNPNGGPTAGGSSVVITGTNFTGVSAVQFGATAATGFTVNSATQITATAPAGTAGTVDVKVTASGGTSATSASDQFTYVAAPTITGNAPITGPSTGGTSVVITGTNLTTVGSVMFGSTMATGFTVNSASQITATAPAGTGTVSLTVTSVGGSATGGSFTYAAAPTVSAVSPTSGPTSGGTVVTVTGSNFNGATSVTFGGLAATGFTVNSATQITATAPAGSGTVDIRVTTPGGTSATSPADQYTYVPAPTVTSLNPTSGPTSGGTTVTITGTNFSGASAVRFGAATVSFTVNSATQITATSPAAAAGTYDVTVTTAGGTSATGAADQFTYIAAPTITGNAPATGPTSGGTSVVITGTNFSMASAVMFGATPATGFTVNSATQITATAPAGTGTVSLAVTTVGGSASGGSFTYVAAPTVTAVSPASGPTAGGTSVVITGTNLTGATAVTFGGVPTSYTVNNATQITALSPAGNGTVDVQVTTAGGTSAANGGDWFSYVNAPVASSFTAATVAFNTGSAGSTSIDLSAHVTNSPTTYAVGSTTTAAGGSVTVDAAGQATYQPPVGFSGNDSFTFTATNAGGTSAPATVTVPVGTPTLSMTPAGPTLPAGTVGAAYSQTLAASGGIAPYSFTLTAGTLPTGLTLTSGGVIQGTPITAGTFVFSVTATDSSPNPGPYSVNRTYTLSIGQGSQTITFANPGAQTYGTSPTLTASSTSGLAVSFSSSTTGVCTITSGGTLTFVGIGTCTINADQAGDSNYSAASTVTQSFTVSTPPLGTSSSNVTGTVAQPLGPVTPVTASGGQPGYTYALTGTLPAGLTFSTATGAISGTPTASLATTTYTVTVTDALGQTTSGTFQLTIGAPTIAVAPATLPNATSGVAYSQTITASGGTAPYTYSVTAGALPTGITLSSTGTLSGTATTAGTYNFTVTATDSSTGAGPFTGSRAYSLRVDLPPPPVIAPVPSQSTPGNTSSNSQSLTIDLAPYISGQYTSVAIVTPTSHGSLTLAGTTATYTPVVGYSGGDSFSFTATGPGGTSAPATVTIDVEGVEPSAANLTATATQSVPVTVDLTAGAAGGPFTGATVLSVSPSGSLTTSIAGDGQGHYILTATPSPTFDGVAVVTYTLSNDFGASAPATVTITVAARPNPAADATVNGVSAAQAEAVRRFAVTQLGNFQRRNEQLHHGGGAGVSTMVSLGSGDDEKLRRAQLAFNVPGWAATEARNAAPTASDIAQDTGVVSLAPPAPAFAARPVGSLALWSGGALTVGSRDDVGDRDGLDFNSQGLSAGLDYRFTEGLTLGIGGGVGWDRTDVGQDDAGRVRSKAWSVAAYGSLMAAPNVFVDGVIGVGDVDNRTRRETANGETAFGDRDGRITFASLGAGYDGRSGNTDLSVYGKLDWLRANLDAYVEQGAGIYDLAFASRRVTSLAGVLGTRASWQLDGWRPHVRAEWRHEFKGVGDQRVDYSDVGSYRFTLGGQDWSTNSFSADVGADVSMGAGLTGGIEVGGGLGKDSRFGTARASIAKQF